MTVHELISSGHNHTCTGCSWHVITYTPSGRHDAAMAKVRAAFDKHLDPKAGVD